MANQFLSDFAKGYIGTLPPDEQAQYLKLDQARGMQQAAHQGGIA